MIDMKNFKVLCGLFFICVGCTHVEKIDTTTVKEHMGDYKIRKVSHAEIAARAEKTGSILAAGFEKEMNDTRITDAWNCDFRKSPLNDSLNRILPGGIRLLNDKDLRDSLAFQPKEFEILQAYRYSAEEGIDAGHNLQQLNDTLYLYTCPVPVNSAFYKACLAPAKTSFAVIEIFLPRPFLVKQIK